MSKFLITKKRGLGGLRGAVNVEYIILISVAAIAAAGGLAVLGGALNNNANKLGNGVDGVKMTIGAAPAAPEDSPALAIGDSYQGGKIAYFLKPGDPGYDANVQHGLIVSPVDQSIDGVQWATALVPSPGNETNYGNRHISVSGTLTTIGSGAANTDKIIAQNTANPGTGDDYAAGVARAYRGGGYSDWYLPSKDELNQFYINRDAIGGFDGNTYLWYWSSSEITSYNWSDGDGPITDYNKNFAWYQDFNPSWGHLGDMGPDAKGSWDCVRAFRSF